MPAVLDAIENGMSASEKPRYTPKTAHLDAYRFKPGQAKPGPGRPKGCKNHQTILLQSAPKLAKAYVKEALKGNATLLKDAREWMMPTDAEQASRSATTIIFAGPTLMLPRDAMALALDAQDGSATGMRVLEVASPSIRSVGDTAAQSIPVDGEPLTQPHAHSDEHPVAEDGQAGVCPADGKGGGI